MKQLTLLIMLMLLTKKAWTQQSETINIPLETKIEVVKTLVAYPLILDKIKLSNELLISSNRLNSILENQIITKDNIILNLKNKLDNLEKEKKLFKIQLRKQKMKSVKIGVLGTLVLGSLVVIK